MIIKEKIEMKSLKRERDIIIYVPDDYLTSKKRYPVLFINDGQNAFFDEEAYIGKSWGFLESIKKLQSAFWIYEQEFVNLLKVTAISHNMLYMDVGGQEDDERYVSSNEHIKKCVEGKLKNFQYRYFPEGKHSEYHWSQRVPIFLKMFYGGK